MLLTVARIGSKVPVSLRTDTCWRTVHSDVVSSTLYIILLFMCLKVFTPAGQHVGIPRIFTCSENS